MLECLICNPTLEFATRINNTTCNSRKEQNVLFIFFKQLFTSLFTHCQVQYLMNNTTKMTM